MADNDHRIGFLERALEKLQEHGNQLSHDLLRLTASVERLEELSKRTPARDYRRPVAAGAAGGGALGAVVFAVLEFIRALIES